VAGLDELARAVRKATATVVPLASADEPPFKGHITVARSRPLRDQSVRERVAGIRCAATFDVESFDLVHSQLSNEGPTYTTLERVAMTADA
jgi:2'-5' RNA ligase